MRLQLAIALILAAQLSGVAAQQGPAPSGGELLTGQGAFGDWTNDRPGLRRKISVPDLPAPFATRSAGNIPSILRPARGAEPKVPEGFAVTAFASGLLGPRMLRTAPNGDIFIAETDAGRIRLIRAAAGAKPDKVETFAKGLDGPFGMAFYPPGSNPRFVYVAETNAVIRYPYANGDIAPHGKAQRVIAQLPISKGGHSTRDIVFSPDGTRMYVSIGSDTNVAEGMSPAPAAEQARFNADHALGAAWGTEAHRAVVMVFDPEGRGGRDLATGIRNCVGLALHPQSGDLWCSVNERDGLGDDLPPDYVTRVKEGGFYGWPWYYLGAHEEPRHKGERPDLADKVTVPDVLVQAHSAPLAMTFYQAPANGAASFPKEYEGDAFVALHGSWNRAKRTGYKVVRVKLDHGVPSGEYQDFLTGFVANDAGVWGRPVGVTVARDGALIVSDDGNGTLWRIAWRGEEK